MATFIQMVNRIAGDLRRSNLTEEIKVAINDAIKEAAQTRFYFNVFDINFTTDDTHSRYANVNGLGEIDFAFRYDGVQKYPLDIINDRAMDRLLHDGNGSTQKGIPEYISRTGERFRLYPYPSGAFDIYVTGYGRLEPYPLVNDADTNAWLDEGELYIRELAKRNVLRDVVRDYGEATVRDAVAEDYKQQLIEATNEKMSTTTLRPTSF